MTLRDRAGIPERERQTMSAMDAVFSDPTQCRRFAPNAAVHWFPPDSVAGDPCQCGEIFKSELSETPDSQEERT